MGGLALRITQSGMIWQLRYRHGSKVHWLTQGTYPECSLKDAKKRAASERARINEGIDRVAGELRLTKRGAEGRIAHALIVASFLAPFTFISSALEAVISLATDSDDIGHPSAKSGTTRFMLLTYEVPTVELAPNPPG
jgi:hypothetical protein